MKANELMIGDLVTSKKWRENPFKLTRINDNGKYYYGITSDGTQVEPFLLEELEPVPLTPEILEKNGFTKHVYGFSFQYLKLQGNLRNDDTVYFTITISGKDIMIDYVHQLQHTLRFCGIDKNIEL